MVGYVAQTQQKRFPMKKNLLILLDLLALNTAMAMEDGIRTKEETQKPNQSFADYLTDIKNPQNKTLAPWIQTKLFPHGEDIITCELSYSFDYEGKVSLKSKNIPSRRNFQIDFNHCMINYFHTENKSFFVVKSINYEYSVDLSHIQYLTALFDTLKEFAKKETNAKFIFGFTDYEKYQKYIDIFQELGFKIGPPPMYCLSLEKCGFRAKEYRAYKKIKRKRS